MCQYLELLLQSVHLSSQGVDDVLPVFQHEVLQVLGRLHLLNVLHTERGKKTQLKYTISIGNFIGQS